MTNPLLAQFIPEARELIQTSVAGLLKLETHPGDAGAINEVFRAVHTLKGSSGLFEAAALTKLVHAAEDLLGMIRTNDLALAPELADGLLDSLDRVNGWIDHLERQGTLPADADAISRDAAAHLRAFAEPPAPAAVVALDAPTDAPGPDAADSSAVSWLAGFSEATRREAFRRACAGEDILALRYRPNESCFYNGTDPLGTVLQTSELVGIHVAPREPLTLSNSYDPYRCILDYGALTAAPRSEIEHLFRYDIEEVEIEPVATRDLVIPTGASDHAVIWSDFAELARGHLDRGDLAGLKASAGALAAMMSADLKPVSALRWIELAIDGGEIGLALLPALIEAAADGQSGVSSAQAGGQTAAMPGGVLGETAWQILDTQRRSLDIAAHSPDHLPAVRQVLSRLATALDAPFLAAEIDACVEVDALTALCDRFETTTVRAEGAAERSVAEISASAARATRPAALAPEPSTADATSRESASGSPATPPARQLKVDQAKIDLMMNLIGELVVSKNSLPFLARRAEEVYGSREMGREIKEQYAIIDRLAQEMQSAVMQVRMLPVSEIFVRFPRLVRDMSRKLGKQIALRIDGGDTAADKTIIEALGDPLLHIMRNSLDHGIETAELRRAAGKPEEATIRLNASQEADSVVIELSDDGRGIDPAAIRKAAVAKGVVDAETAGRLSDQEAINLIYAPGFSTAEAISDLSGRGVGMDVVLTTVQRLGGTVQVTSQVGIGTTTRLSLPLSMAVTRVMVVEAGGTLYGIPMDLIVETVRVPASLIRTIKRAETFVLRNTVIPLRRMTQLLAMPAREDVPQEEAVLVCRVNGHQVGLVIDNFREGIEVLLKPLEGILAHVRGYSGTALLGDGRVLLVLNLKELL